MKRALVIGINDYPDRLLGSINDANAFAARMARHGDGRYNMEVKLKTDPPSQAFLMSYIQELFDAPGSLSVLFFSGHGYVNTLGGYILAPDTQMFNEGIHMDRIIQLANQSPATNKVIILDCCFAGAIAEAEMKSGLNISIRDGVTILTSSRKNELSHEKKLQGVFTALLLQALDGGAADIRGHITPASIYAYVDQALGAFGQRPVFKTNTTQFVSLREVVSQLPLEALDMITTYFPDPDKEKALNPSFEFTNDPTWVPLREPPYAEPANVAVFKHLQKMQSVGLVVPCGEDHLFFAAMHQKSCKLTPLGKHYWRLVKEGKIRP